jgi:Protein of unknown function (DUF2721)
MSLDTLTSQQFSIVISQAAAPAFLLGAAASFLSVLFKQLSSLIDRLQAISALPDENAASAKLKASRPLLKSRASNVAWAIYWTIGSGIATCFVIVTAFAGTLFGVGYEFGAAILFTMSLALFIVGLITFGYEIRLGLRHVKFD